MKSGFSFALQHHNLALERHTNGVKSYMCILLSTSLMLQCLIIKITMVQVVFIQFIINATELSCQKKKKRYIFPLIVNGSLIALL